jgi:hypothetical protein
MFLLLCSLLDLVYGFRACASEKASPSLANRAFHWSVCKRNVGELSTYPVLKVVAWGGQCHKGYQTSNDGETHGEGCSLLGISTSCICASGTPFPLL